MTLKERFKSSFSYTWYFYLIALVLPSVAFPLAYSFMHRPQQYEKLSLFISSSLKDDSFEKALEDKFSPLGVKSVEVVSFDPMLSESMYLKKLNVVGINRCDVLLIPEDKLNTLNPSGCMVEFNDDIKSLCSSQEEEYFTYEEKDFAIKLTSVSPVGEYATLTSNTNYYLFLGGSSWNTGEYSSKAKTTGNAFELIKYLIGK